MSHLRTALGGAALALTLVGPAAAAEPSFFADPIYDSPLFNFEGFYVGLQGGIVYAAAPATFSGLVGVAIGANFMLSEAILAGLEFQGDVYFGGGGFAGGDMLLLARVGGFLSDNLMIYGAAGGGMINGAGSYALGAGVELPISNPFSVRGEVLGTGTWGGGFDGVRATAGVLWHMN